MPRVMFYLPYKRAKRRLSFPEVGEQDLTRAALDIDCVGSNCAGPHLLPSVRIDSGAPKGLRSLIPYAY
jgi:hypothetical protein